MTNPLLDFLGKNLNPLDWSVHSANPDSKIRNRFAITLKAVQDHVLFDENTEKSITVKKNGYVRGLVEPTTGCVRVVLYVEPQGGLEDDVLLHSYSLKDVVPTKNTSVVVHAYIPDRDTAIKLHQMEKNAVRAKKNLTDALPYEPDFGIKYNEHVSDPEFKKRWNVKKCH